MAAADKKASASKSKSKYFGQGEGEDERLSSGTRRSPRKSKVVARLDSDDLDGESEGEGRKRKRKAPAKRGRTKKQESDFEEEEADGVLDSDNLDEDFDEGAKKGSAKKKLPGSPKKRSRVATGGEESELELAEGQEVVGAVVKAPATGRVPPGQISRNTLRFLGELGKPECNDRQWFKLHEPVYRLAEKEFKDFVEAFTDVLVECDAQIPPLPPKDVMHRIYRDMRFSNDKTPYKTGFSASFSRSGRKGIFAHYHVLVKPGGESLIAAGAWCPGKNELQTIRNNILRSPARLRKILSHPEFVKLFGEPKPHPKGYRQSVFGFEDELKTAPKGVDKEHKDIDLLKLRTFSVVHRFSDDEVLDPGWKEELGRIVGIARPFVHCLNDMMTIPGDDEDSSDHDGDGENGGDGDEETSALSEE
ncbi:hypothetical protein NEOLEDRAFT_1132677 [Neolentinus lepideus HHB14362 ss-1]|uniref:Uncharacterized protein n=1 Tax=Neolentinus lepideus HHB14362 ss-1 TaxID=1314782 RepID=A0A165T490_9AGAM|nr:hypothetical protein NEOLEDRAFT_1132677 [Neolentinus lepideus HHB14362 ss-1]